MSNTQPETDAEINVLRRLIALLGFFLLLCSQILIFSKPFENNIVFPPYTWLSVVGVGIFVLGLVLRPTPFLQKVSARFAFSDQAFWILVAILLSIVTTLATASFLIFSTLNYIPVITLWFLGAGSYIYAFSKEKFTLQKWTVWLKTHRNEILIVLVVMILATALRFYRLGSIPRVLDGDEGLIGLFAQTTTSGELANPFALWENFGALYLQTIDIALKIFGINAFALRLLPAIGGILAIPATYLLARQIGGRRIALIAAIFVAISHTHVHFSRIASVAYIQGTWLAPFELYFLLSGIEQRKSWRTAIAGVLLAIHLSIYLTAQIVFGLVVAYMLIALVFYRAWFKPALRQALVFWAGFAITATPQIYYILKLPNNFLNRLTQDGTIQSGWLVETAQRTGQSMAQILFERVVHAFMSLIYFPAIDFYGSNNPMLSMLSSTLFLIGLGVALWWVRKPGFLLLNGYFWGATLSVGLFAIPPSADSYRMLVAFPAAIILAALGLDQTLEAIGLGWQKSRNAYVFSAGFVLTSLLIFNLWIYYGDFAGQCRYGGNLVGRFASYLGSYTSTIENESNIYLLSNTNYFYGSHASTDFLNQVRPITNVPEPLDEVEFVSGELLIAPPDRIEELQTWAREHPGGVVHYLYDCQTTILMSYLLP